MSVFDLFDPIGIPARLQVRVTPRAKRAQIKREMQQDGTILFRVYVTAPAEDGAANAAVIAALADAFGIAKSSLTIAHGLTSRYKIIAVNQN